MPVQSPGRARSAGKVLRLALYNCLSLLSAGRVEENYAEFRTSATLLTGTKVKCLAGRARPSYTTRTPMILTGIGATPIDKFTDLYNTAKNNSGNLEKDLDTPSPDKAWERWVGTVRKVAAQHFERQKTDQHSEASFATSQTSNAESASAMAARGGTRLR